jgi:uncharacterized protein
LEYLVANRYFHRAIAGICLGTLVAFEASRAWAQQAAPAPAQPAAPAPAPAPPLPPLPASHLAVAREVMNASGIAQSFDPIISNIALQLMQAYTQKRPANAKDFEEILIGMKPELDTRKSELVAKAAEIYARKIDEPSLKAALVFFQSPAGMKYTAALPQVLNEVAAATDVWTKDVATRMGTHVVEEMKKRGVDLGR